jgi:hypothetical protein
MAISSGCDPIVGSAPSSSMRRTMVGDKRRLAAARGTNRLRLDTLVLRGFKCAPASRRTDAACPASVQPHNRAEYSADGRKKSSSSGQAGVSASDLELPPTPSSNE